MKLLESVSRHGDAVILIMIFMVIVSLAVGNVVDGLVDKIHKHELDMARIKAAIVQVEGVTK